MTALALVFFFFFQLVTNFVEAIYAFGLLGTDIPPEIVAVLLFFSPAVLLFFRRAPGRKVLLGFGIVVLLTGGVLGVLDSRWRMLASGLGVGTFLIFFPGLLARLAREGKRQQGIPLGLGLGLALALEIFTYAWNSGVNLFTQPAWQPLTWGLAGLGVVLLARWMQGFSSPASGTENSHSQVSFGRLAGLSLGAVVVLTLLYFAFTNPSVLSRWTGASYPLTLGLALLALMLYVALRYFLARGSLQVSQVFLLSWNALFVACLVLTILSQQLRFPVSEQGYPFFEPAAGLLNGWPFYAMLLLFPVVLLDFEVFCQELISPPATIRALGGAFLLAALFLVLMVFGQVFTTVYDYIPVVGPLLRDRFWAVFLVLGLGAGLPTLLVRTPRLRNVPYPFFPVGLTGLLTAAAFAGAFVLSAKPVPPAQNPAAVRIITYNIQQGYDANGQKGYLAQADLLRQANADVIGLEESDTARISGGNSDIVRYFADQLGMYSYYGPKVVAGTFGIALLSKYPIENPRTFYMYSTGEQTAAILAQVTVGGVTYHLLVTHLGNGGPIVQQQAVLQEVKGVQKLVSMGDFNFRPDGDQYRLTTSVLKDAWLMRWPSGVDAEGVNPVDRIDHVFVSPDVEVVEAQYLDGGQSDHPALVVEVK